MRTTRGVCVFPTTSWAAKLKWARRGHDLLASWLDDATKLSVERRQRCVLLGAYAVLLLPVRCGYRRLWLAAR